MQRGRPDASHFLDTGLDETLSESLSSWVRRWRILTCLKGLCWSLTTFLVLFLLAVLLDRFFFLQPAVHQGLSAAVGLVTLAVFLCTVFWTLFRPFPDARVASRAEEQCPESRGYLLSAVELRAREDAAAGDSLDLRRQVQLQARRVAAAIEGWRVFPVKSSGIRSALAFLLFGGSLNIVAALVPFLGYFQGAHRFLSPFSNPRRFSVTRVELLPGDLTLPLGDDLVVVALVHHWPAKKADLHWVSAPERLDSSAEAAADEVVPPFAVEGEDVPPALDSGVLAMTPVGGAAQSDGGDVDRTDGPRRFQTRLEKVRRSLVLSVRSGDGESPESQVRVFPRPQAMGFVKTYHAPNYLHRAPIVLEEGHGNLTGLQGSYVDMVVEVSQPLAKAQLEVLAEGGVTREIQMTVAGKVAKLDQFLLDRTGTYRLTLTALGTGFLNLWSPSYDIRLDVDQPPSIEVLEPRSNSLVPSDARLPVTLRVRDDYGIDTVREGLSVNGNAPRSVEVDWPQGKLESDWHGFVDLRALGVSMGDRLRVVYEVRDLRGSVVKAPAVELTVVDSGWQRLGPNTSEILRQVLEAFASLSDAARPLFVSWDRLSRRIGGEESLRPAMVDDFRALLLKTEAWISTAEECLGLLQKGVSGARDFETGEDLLLLHAALKSILEDNMRPAAVLLRALHSDRRPKEIVSLRRAASVAVKEWEVGYRSCERLFKDAGSLALSLEVDRGAYWKLLSLASCFQLQGTRAGLSASEAERLTRQRVAMVQELKVVLEQLRRFPSDLLRVGRERALWNALSKRFDGLSDNVAAVEGNLGDGGWQALGDALNRALEAGWREIERLRLVTRDLRTRILSMGRRDSEALSDLAQRAEAYENAWKKLLSQSSVEGAAASRFVSRWSAVRRTADPLVLNAAGDLTLDPIHTRLLRTTDGVESSQTVDRRFIADLSLLDRVVERLGERQSNGAKLQFYRAVGTGNRDNVQVVKGTLVDNNGEYLDRMVEDLTLAAELFSRLELSHELGSLVQDGSDLHPLEERLACRSETLARELAERFDRFLGRFSLLVGLAKRVGVDDLALALDRIEDSLEMGLVRQTNNRRARLEVESDEERSRLLLALGWIQRGLATLYQEETPAIRDAREKLRQLAPSLLEEIVSTLEHARRVSATTRRLTSVDSFSGEEMEGLLDLEDTTSRRVRRLRERLEKRASALDLEDRQAIETARDLDVAVQALKEPAPSAADFLTAAGFSVRFRDEALEKALTLQERRVWTLELLQRHFGNGSELSGEEMRRLEEELGIQERLDATYETVRYLSEWHQQELALLEATGEASRRQEQRNDATQESLEELAQLEREQRQLEGTVAEAIDDSSHGRASLRDLFDRQLQALRRELEYQEGRQAQFNDRREQEARNVEAGFVKMRADSTGLERGSQRIIEEELAILARLARALFGVNEAHEIDRMDGKLRGAIEETDLALENFSEDLRSTTQTFRHLAIILSESSEALSVFIAKVDPLKQPVEDEENTLGSPELRRARLAAIDIVDRLRHLELKLSQEASRRDSAWRAEEQLFSERLREIEARKQRELRNPKRFADLLKEERQLQEENSRWKLRRVQEYRRRQRALEELARRVVRDNRQLNEISTNLKSENAEARTQLTGDLAAAIAELALAGQYLESYRTLDARRNLDRALEKLGGDRGDAAQLVDRAAVVRDTLTDFSSVAQRLADGLEELSEKAHHDRRQLAREEQLLIERVDGTSAGLQRAESHARRLRNGWEGNIERARTLLDTEALPSLRQLLVELTGTGALSESMLTSGQSDPGRMAREALLKAREVLSARGELGDDRLEPPERGARGAIEEPQVASSMAEALDQMVGASAALERKKTKAAEGFQRAAAAALRKALDGASRKVADERQRDLQSAQPGSAAGADGPGGEKGDEEELAQASSSAPLGQEAPSAEGAVGNEVLKSLMEGKNLGDWARLPTRIKRELLQGHRESIPPRYQQAVEAYFRALAAAAQSR